MYVIILVPRGDVSRVFRVTGTMIRLTASEEGDGQLDDLNHQENIQLEEEDDGVSRRTASEFGDLEEKGSEHGCQNFLDSQRQILPVAESESLERRSQQASTNFAHDETNKAFQEINGFRQEVEEVRELCKIQLKIAESRLQSPSDDES